MQRDELVKLLRQQEKLRLQVERVDTALGLLTQGEREIIDKMVVRPKPGASDELCEMFDIEVASVYRRRNKALKKLGEFLAEVR